MKSLKTSFAVDVGISLATGTPFLGVFEVPRAVTVAIVSGESGRSTLQSTAQLVFAAKEFDRTAIGGRLHWCFDLPVLSDLVGVAEFVEGLFSRGVQVVILDPLYLMLGAVDAKSMFETGPLLRIVATMMIDKGITPIILHHANRTLPIGDVMELQHLAYSGLDQFLRQFVLLNRREKYLQDGVHKLWARIGGSAGHGGLYGVDVDEGVMTEDFGGRKWDVTVMNVADLPKGDDREEKAASKVRETLSKETVKVLEAIDAELAKGEPAATKAKIEEHASWHSSKVTKVTGRLLEDGTIEEHSWKKPIGKNAKREVVGYRRPVKSEQTNIQFDHGGDAGFPHDNPTIPHDPGSSERTWSDHGGELSPLKGDTPPIPHDPEPRETEVAPKTKTKTKKPRKKGKAPR